MSLNDRYRKNYQDEYDELIVKMATSEYIDSLGQAIEEKKNQLARENKYPIPDNNLLLFKKELKKKERRKRNVSLIRSMNRVGKKVAIFFCIVTSIFIGGVSTVEAFRINILNLLIETPEKYSNIQLSDEKVTQASNLSEEWEDYYYPRYVPEGFTVKKASISMGVGEIVYNNNDNKKVMYSMNAKKQNLFIDTEDIEYTEIMINEYPGQLIKKKRHYTVVFQNNEYLFTVSGDIEPKELIKICESIKK